MTADSELIAFLTCFTEEAVLIDNYGNPILVNVPELREEALQIYNAVTIDWYTEFQELQNLR